MNRINTKDVSPGNPFGIESIFLLVFSFVTIKDVIKYKRVNRRFQRYLSNYFDFDFIFNEANQESWRQTKEFVFYSHYCSIYFCWKSLRCLNRIKHEISNSISNIVEFYFHCLNWYRDLCIFEKKPPSCVTRSQTMVCNTRFRRFDAPPKIDCGVIKENRLRFGIGKEESIKSEENGLIKMNCHIFGMIYKLRYLFCLKIEKNSDAQGVYGLLGYFVLSIIYNIKPISNLFIDKFEKNKDFRDVVSVCREQSINYVSRLVYSHYRKFAQDNFGSMFWIGVRMNNNNNGSVICFTPDTSLLCFSLIFSDRKYWYKLILQWANNSIINNNCLFYGVFSFLCLFLDKSCISNNSNKNNNL